jgi:hypothetical protein
MCPFAWMTSQWLLETEKVRDITARFNVMSLSVLNENRDDLSEEYAAAMKKGMGPVRLMTAVEQAHGKDAAREFYLALATLRHNNKEEFSREIFEQALEAAGLDTSLAAKANDASLDDAVRKSHEAGMNPVGQDVGTPVVHFPKGDGSTTAFFGPVIVPPPTGEEAGQLLDGLKTIASTDGLYELKRSRNRRPSFLPMP